MVEMLTMLILHTLKSIDFFINSGLPAILDKLPEAAAALAWQIAKIIEIYSSLSGNPMP